ncbi:MAG: VOC family protein [Rhodospirillaceae bacterium]
MIRFALALLVSITVFAAAPSFADNHLGESAGNHLGESAGNNDIKSDDERYVRLKRPNLVVPDLDAALKFYVDHLGFTFAYAEDSAINPDTNFAYHAFNFDPTKAIRQATLHTSVEERGFALTEVLGLEAEITRTPSLTAMVVETKRFMALRDDLIAEGYTVTDYRDTSKNNSDGVGILEMGVLDPAGHLIVVYEYVGVVE